LFSIAIGPPQTFPIAHQPTIVDEFSYPIEGRQVVLGRQFNDLRPKVDNSGSSGRRKSAVAFSRSAMSNHAIPFAGSARHSYCGATPS
jgi:hypothetical protein